MHHGNNSVVYNLAVIGARYCWQRQIFLCIRATVFRFQDPKYRSRPCLFSCFSHNDLRPWLITRSCQKEKNFVVFLDYSFTTTFQASINQFARAISFFLPRRYVSQSLALPPCSKWLVPSKTIFITLNNISLFFCLFSRCIAKPSGYDSGRSSGSSRTVAAKTPILHILTHFEETAQDFWLLV